MKHKKVDEKESFTVIDGEKIFRDYKITCFCTGINGQRVDQTFTYHRSSWLLRHRQKSACIHFMESCHNTFIKVELSVSCDKCGYDTIHVGGDNEACLCYACAEKLYETCIVKVGDFVEVNTKHRRYKVAHAPRGGRTVELGPKHKKPFAMLIPSAHIMDGCPVKSGVKIDIGQEFEIENYGLHIILAQRPFDGDSVRIFRKEDGFIS